VVPQADAEVVRAAGSDDAYDGAGGQLTQPAVDLTGCQLAAVEHDLLGGRRHRQDRGHLFTQE